MGVLDGVVLCDTFLDGVVALDVLEVFRDGVDGRSVAEFISFLGEGLADLLLTAGLLDTDELSFRRLME